MIRHTYAAPTPALTGGEERPRPACSLAPYWFDQAAGEAREGRERDYAIAQAKAICATCPLTGPDGSCVRDNPNAPGVVGGLTAQERGALNRRAKCGTESSYRSHRKRGENCPECSRAATKAAAARKARKAAA